MPRDWLQALDDTEQSNTNTHRETAAAPPAAAAPAAAAPASDVEDPRTIHHFSFDWSGLHDHHKPTLPPMPSIPGVPSEHRYLAWTSENEEEGQLVRRQQQQAGNGEASSSPSERTFHGSFNWDLPTLPPLPTHPALPPSLDGLFPPSLPDALWQIRLVIQGAPSLIEENRTEVAARFKALLDHILSSSSSPGASSSYDGAVRVEFSSLATALGAGSKLRGSVDPLLKEAEEAPLPSSCAEAAAAAALPTFMVVEGNGPVVKEVLNAALMSETFPSIFDMPSDYCGVKVSQIIMA
eukprot:evm.model.NODE_9217_length_6882_cov_23.876053.2